MMTAVGFGILLSMIWSADICVFYFVGFILAKSLGLSSLGIAVLGAAIALTLFFVEKNIVDTRNSVKATDQAAVAGPANSEEDFF
jgi:PTS system mannose-specific IIC component/fructoselysine and glucoselysine-specific PTS system IIC component